MDYVCIECGTKPIGANSDECRTCEAHLFWVSWYVAMRIEGERK